MARESLLLMTLAALAGGSLWLRGSAAAPTEHTTAPAASTIAAAAATTAAVGDLSPAAAVAAPAAAPDRSRQLELPDGTFVEALNGATNPKPLAEFWGSQVPWSPIVGIEHNDQGVAWFRHANGSYSTTETRWDRAGKRHVTLTRVAHQGPATTPSVAAGERR